MFKPMKKVINGSANGDVGNIDGAHHSIAFANMEDDADAFKNSSREGSVSQDIVAQPLTMWLMKLKFMPEGEDFVQQHIQGGESGSSNDNADGVAKASEENADGFSIGLRSR